MVGVFFVCFSGELNILEGPEEVRSRFRRRTRRTTSFNLCLPNLRRGVLITPFTDGHHRLPHLQNGTAGSTEDW